LQEISLEAMEERANQRERWPSKCFVWVSRCSSKNVGQMGCWDKRAKEEN
jgi:hypothetical protein